MVKKYGVTPVKENIFDITRFGAIGDGKTDDTASIQASLNKAAENGGGIVYIPEGTYMVRVTDADGEQTATAPWVTTRGLKVDSNTTLVFDKNAKLSAIPNNSWSYTMFNLKDVHDVNILGGELIGDRANHDTKYTQSFRRSPSYQGETGWGILLAGSQNVKIIGNNIHDFWGDGIDLYGENGLDKNNENITIKDNVIDHNRRQGISIENADGVLIEGNTISNTNGTTPQSGIDIEPTDWANTSMRKANNITIRNNTFKNNNGSGVQTYGMSSHAEGFENGPTEISNLVIDQNIFDGNNTNAWNIQDKGGWDKAFNGQLTILGVDSAKVTNNKFINPNPAGMNAVNGDSDQEEPANAYLTAGIYDGYNKSVDIEGNYLPGQDIVVAGGRSLNYRYPENAGTIKDNILNEIIVDQAISENTRNNGIHVENNTTGK